MLPNGWQVDGVGDFNADGKDDLVWRRADGAFTTWLGQANGGFVSNDANAFTVLPTSWQVAATGDFNADGRDDIAWRRSDGAFTTWLAQGNGSFVSNDANAWTVLPNGWQVDGVGDFNNDGKDDLSIGTPGEDYGEFANWITEEQGEIPTDLASGVSISIDEQTDAGIVQIVNGPMPTPTDPPDVEDIIVRTGTDAFQGLGEGIRGGLQSLPGGFFDDNQIPAPTNGDQTWSDDLTGDTFGAGQG
jgi:hypothetical protein